MLLGIKVVSGNYYDLLIPAHHVATVNSDTHHADTPFKLRGKLCSLRQGADCPRKVRVSAAMLIGSP